MEPMALGSPGSPPAASSACLPPFLLGTPATGSTSPIKAGPVINSPYFPSTPVIITKLSNANEHMRRPSRCCWYCGQSMPAHEQVVNIQLGVSTTQSPVHHTTAQPTDKHPNPFLHPPPAETLSLNLPHLMLGRMETSATAGGPPTLGLWDTLETTTVPQPSTANLHSNTFSNVTPIKKNDSSHLNLSMTGGADVSFNETNNWVTVFGFPTGSASEVLAHFLQIGQVMEHKFATKGNNWLHIRFYSARDMKRALSYNGRPLTSNGSMIGVTVCKDFHPKLQDVTNRLGMTSPLSPPLHENSFRQQTVSPHHASWATSSPLNPQRYSTLASPSRPVRSLAHDSMVFAHEDTPKQNKSIITQTIDYILGW